MCDQMTKVEVMRFDQYSSVLWCICCSRCLLHGHVIVTVGAMQISHTAVSLKSMGLASSSSRYVSAVYHLFRQACVRACPTQAARS